MNTTQMNPLETYAKVEYAALRKGLRIFPSDNYEVEVETVEDWGTVVNIFPMGATNAYWTDKRGRAHLLNGVRVVVEEGQLAFYRHSNGSTGESVKLSNLYIDSVINTIVREMLRGE